MKTNKTPGLCTNPHVYLKHTKDTTSTKNYGRASIAQGATIIKHMFSPFSPLLFTHMNVLWYIFVMLSYVQA